MTRLGPTVVAALSMLWGCRAPSSPTTSADARAEAFEAMVVGTAHRGHLQVADYPLSRLDELIAAFRPDLVLVEIRPEPFAEGRFEDGPLEMSYVTMHARARGLAVEPIDWYLDADVGKEIAPGEDSDARAAYEREVGALARAVDVLAPFAILNGDTRARQLLSVQNAAERYALPESVAWRQRQAWFHRRAQLAIEKHAAKRVVAFVGFAHRPDLDLWMHALGGVTVSPLAMIDAKTWSAKPVDDDVLAFWKAGVARLRVQADAAAPPAKKRLLAKVRYWEIAIERRGLCCVEDAAFAPP